MRRRFVQLLAAIALTLAYTLLFFYGTRLVNTVGAPPWWVSLWPSVLAGAFVWFSLERAMAVIIIALPVGLSIAFLYPRRAVLVATTIGVVAFVMGQAPLVMRLSDTDALIKTTLLLDLVAMSIAPAAIASAATRLPSNNRWRGP